MRRQRYWGVVIVETSWCLDACAEEFQTAWCVNREWIGYLVMRANRLTNRDQSWIIPAVPRSCGLLGRRSAEMSASERQKRRERLSWKRAGCCKGGILLEDVNRTIPSINCFTALLIWRSNPLLIIPVRNVYWIDCGGVNAFLNCEIASSWFWVREARRRQPCINGGGTWMAMENECW